LMTSVVFMPHSLLVFWWLIGAAIMRRLPRKIKSLRAALRCRAAASKRVRACKAFAVPWQISRRANELATMLRLAPQ